MQTNAYSDALFIGTVFISHFKIVLLCYGVKDKFPFSFYLFIRWMHANSMGCNQMDQIMYSLCTLFIFINIIYKNLQKSNAKTSIIWNSLLPLTWINEHIHTKYSKIGFRNSYRNTAASHILWCRSGVLITNSISAFMPYLFCSVNFARAEKKEKEEDRKRNYASALFE